MKLADQSSSIPQSIQISGGLAGKYVEGSGDKVLWIHGYTLDSTIWEELWSHLPGWWHIGIDLPGHGRSRPLRPGESLRSLAIELGQFAKEHEIRHVVALSFGTVIALQLAIEFPRLFRTLSLGAPAVGCGPQDACVRQLYTLLRQVEQREGAGPHLGALWLSSPPYLFQAARQQPALWPKVVSVVERHRWSELRDNAMHLLFNHPQTEAELRTIQSSTLVLVGDQDLPAFLRCAEIIRRSVPVSRRVYLPMLGHLCLLEDACAIARLLDGHLHTNALHSPHAEKGSVRIIDKADIKYE